VRLTTNNCGKFATILLVTCALSLMNNATAEEKAEQARSFEQLMTDITREQNNIDKLVKREAGDNRLLEAAIDSRLLHARMNLLESNLAVISHAAEAGSAGQATVEQRQQASTVFAEQLRAIETTSQMIKKKIIPPEEQLSAAETAAIYSRLFNQIDQLNRVYRIYIESIQQARKLDIDVAAESEKLKQSLLDRAENGSVLLEMAMAEISALRASIAAVPGDAETRARLNVVTTNVTSLANGMSQILEMMKGLEMDITQYQNQLLLATGQITTDIFQVDVFTDLFVGWSETLWAQVIEEGPGLVFNLILLAIIIYIFYKLAGLVRNVTERALEDARVELSQLLKRMVISIASNTVLVIGILIALSQVGISLGPLLAGMGLVGFIVGFALQDTLSNFAAGMLILVYRPFDVDDVIEAGGVSGKVSKMSLVNTTFLTFDNQTIIVPNSKIWGDVIKNVTAQNIRRIDLVFGIAYSDDIEKAEKVMAEVVAAHPAVLDDPETMIRLHELGDSSVNFIVRPWVNRDDYWETYWDLMRAMKMRFDEEGISIPFPQRDVHLYQEQAPSA
jgi:small conductance mechanosensitive channel